jgi:hypothetical protein
MCLLVLLESSDPVSGPGQVKFNTGKDELTNKFRSQKNIRRFFDILNAFPRSGMQILQSGFSREE